MHLKLKTRVSRSSQKDEDEEMKIKFLGIWSSHLIQFQRNVSISIDDKIVIEFGPHTMESLSENHVDPRKIEIVLISHMHLDHFSGLPELLWYRTEFKERKATLNGSAEWKYLVKEFVLNTIPILNRIT